MNDEKEYRCEHCNALMMERETVKTGEFILHICVCLECGNAEIFAEKQRW